MSFKHRYKTELRSYRRKVTLETEIFRRVLGLIFEAIFDDRMHIFVEYPREYKFNVTQYFTQILLLKYSNTFLYSTSITNLVMTETEAKVVFFFQNKIPCLK